MDLVSRIHALPDLLERAILEAGPDRYKVQDRLRREHEEAGLPFFWSMPYRSPAQPCSRGAHQVPVTLHEIGVPGRGLVKLWEAELHEIESHGAGVPADLKRLLDDLPAPPPDETGPGKRPVREGA